MAKSKLERMKDYIQNMTECAICKEPFKEPKILPCIHTFCLPCLEKYGESEEKEPGDTIPCPLCRNEFKVPSGSFRELRNNYFMTQLMQVNRQPSSIESPDEQIACEVCLKMSEDSLASFYCIECAQNLCELCCRRHQATTCLQAHTVVKLTDKPTAEDLRKIAPQSCEEHPNKQIEFYCYDCKMTACVTCYDNDHIMHNCCGVRTSADRFRVQLAVDIDRISDCASLCRVQTKLVETETFELITDVEKTLAKISDRYNQLRTILDRHQELLEEELRSFKEKRLKELETRKDETERQFLIMESFRRYCEEMKDKGSSCDISRAADDLHVRANELVLSQVEFTNTQSTLCTETVDVTFTEQLLLSDVTKNWIGVLSYKMRNCDESGKDDAISGSESSEPQGNSPPDSDNITDPDAASKPITHLAKQDWYTPDVPNENTIDAKSRSQTLDRDVSISQKQTVVETRPKSLHFFADKDDNWCSICLDKIKKSKSLPCKHKFCKRCIDDHFKKFPPSCPTCGKHFGGMIKGNQPADGNITINNWTYSLDGYPGCGTIEMTYHFSNGTQADNHPNPGKWYRGTSGAIYFPNNREGREVFNLFQQAFNAGLLFTIGQNDAVIWSNINPKTAQTGRDGYPDPTYLSRVREQLLAKGLGTRR